MGQPARHRVDHCPDRNCRHSRVKVGTELALRLVPSEVLLENMHRGVNVRVDVLQADSDDAASDLDDGHHVVAVVSHEGEVRFDIGPQESGAGRHLGNDARLHVSQASLDNLEYHLLDQVVLACEVIPDQALADPDALAYPGQRRPRVKPTSAIVSIAASMI